MPAHEHQRLEGKYRTQTARLTQHLFKVRSYSAVQNRTLANALPIWTHNRSRSANVVEYGSNCLGFKECA